MAPVRNGRRDGRAGGRLEGNAAIDVVGVEACISQPPGLAPPGLGNVKAAMAPAKVELAAFLSPTRPGSPYIPGPLGLHTPYAESQVALAMQQHRAMHAAAAQLHYAAACAQHQQQIMLQNMHAASVMRQAAAEASAAAELSSVAAKPLPPPPRTPAPGDAQRAKAPPKEVANATRTAERRGHDAQTLSSSLQALSGEPPDCLFIVRRINKLGFKASRTLKRYFSTFGNVVRVLVAHSTVRQHGDPQSHARRRPSSLGFIQMASSSAVLQILARGNTQEIEGSQILVQQFERQDDAEDEDGDDCDIACDEGPLGDASPASVSAECCPRGLRSFSEATTASTSGSYPASPVLKASTAEAAVQ